ncbi:MAG: hypothetical protein R3D43_15200 [Tepidamorphaceae bacterium]
MLEREFRRIRKRFDDHDRRIRAMCLTGVVTEVKGDRVQLELEPLNQKTGKKFLSPWVRWQEAAGDGGGGYSSHTPPAKGEHMMLHSPSGEVGEASLAVRGAYNDPNPDPSGGDTKEFRLKHGDASIVMRDSYIELSVGGQRVVLDGGEIVTYGKTRLNDGKRKVHYVDGLDTDGDAAVDGADAVFV